MFPAPQQTTEQEFYGNVKHSADFEEFLNFLGDKVELKGWQGFRAGLDVRTGTTGTHSIFTKFMELSIMFHVSTFLPFSQLDPQQVFLLVLHIGYVFNRLILYRLNESAIWGMI